ncbi:glycosyltransferase [Pirellulales bacterium]|nr:glycosyltransferase [Pirellulales bacterium]
MTRVCIVIPCFNEATRLSAQPYVAAGESLPNVSFVFVNDGSADNTSVVLNEIKQAASDRVEVIELPENRGKGEAVRHGVLESAKCGPALIGYLDADLATPLGAIGDLQQVLESRPDIEFVFGSRVALLGRRIRRRWVRHASGRIFASVVSALYDLPIYDTQCGAKLFRASEENLRLFRDPFITEWLFDLEIIARMTQAHANLEGRLPAERIYEFPLNEWRDVPGSKIGILDGIRAAVQLWKIKRHYR